MKSPLFFAKKSLTLLLAAAPFFLGPSVGAVTLIHSNDILGEIEPCGCRTNPLGGMARVFHFLEKAKEQDPSLVLVDGGDLLFSTLDIPEPLREQNLLQARYLIKALNMVHYDAAVPGEKDFSLGVQAFEHLRQEAKIAFLAANLKRKNGKAFLPGHILIERKSASGKKLRIAIIGLVDPELQWPKELKAAPVIPTAKAEVASLRKKADIIIALTHEGADLDRALATAVSGIDLIVGGHSQSFLQTPEVVENGGKKTHIYQSSFRNQYLGSLPLALPINDENYKLTALDAGYDSPAGSPSVMDQWITKFKSAIAELNAKEEATLAKDDAVGPKFQSFPRCAECHLKQFEFWRKTPHAHALDPLISAHQEQNKECLQCHTVGFADKQGWSSVADLVSIMNGGADGQKPHPITLTEWHPFLQAMNKADSNDSPVPFPAQPSPIPLSSALGKTTRSMIPVQCENCHQPGRDHPFSSGYKKTVAQNACIQCHTADRAPEWYQGTKPNWELIAEKFKSMTCPAGDPTVQ